MFRTHLNELHNWFSLWRVKIKINANKSAHKIVLLNIGNNLIINNGTILQKLTIKKLTWGNYINRKTKSFNI